MNRDEKNANTRRKIIDSALEQFNAYRYDGASLNALCAAGGISKGIIYHYFKDKEELYLACVQECIDALRQHLAAQVKVDELPVESALAGYFDARMAFFAQNPQYRGVFYSAVLRDPAQLGARLTEAFAPLDAQSADILTLLLGRVPLRADVTVAEVVEFFRGYQDFVNMSFPRQAPDESALQLHEARCRRSLQILLYGVVRRDG